MLSPHFAPLARLALPAAALAALLAGPSASAQTTVYTNTFTGGAGPEWSNNAVDTTPGTASHAPDKFLGQFGRQATTLTLNGLATHTTTTVAFDLYMIRSMDGNGPAGGGADTWSLSENSNSLIATTFANYPGNTQGFGGADGMGGYRTSGAYAPYTGSTEQNTLGYTFGGPMDAVYHFAFTFTDAAPTLALTFLGNPTEGLDNESWGLDNVVVQTNAAAPVPEASTTVSLGLLLTLGLGGLAAAKRKKTA